MPNVEIWWEEPTAGGQTQEATARLLIGPTPAHGDVPTPACTAVPGNSTHLSGTALSSVTKDTWPYEYLNVTRTNEQLTFNFISFQLIQI